MNVPRVPAFTTPKVPCHRRGYAQRRARKIEALVAVVIAARFTLKTLNYVDPASLRPSTIVSTASRAVRNAANAIGNLPALNSCAHPLRMYDVPGGYVCAPSDPSTVYAQIFTTYPLVGQGRESIYSNIDEGSLPAANDLLLNNFAVPRYPLVHLGSLTWSEDPFHADYWRMEFYSLRPSLNLLYTFRTTEKVKYATKLLDLDMSFIASEPTSKWAWSDAHAVAFRCMALVDTWWKLRQAHQLTEPESTAILRELVKTGPFLVDPNNYQPEDNHGTNEAAALYELAVAFPTLPASHQWLALAQQRLQEQLDSLIDADGDLIENSPYYDFYTLDKYWQDLQLFNRARRTDQHRFCKQASFNAKLCHLHSATKLASSTPGRLHRGDH